MGVLKKANIPNFITISRFIVIVPICYFIIQQVFVWALILFLLAGISDGLDGLLARRYQWQSRFGSIADPLADKCLLMLSFICLAWVKAIPLWLMLVVIGRDVVIIAGAYAYHCLIGRYDLRPSFISKVNTVTQLVFIVLVLTHFSITKIPNELMVTGIYTVLLTSVVSGCHYIYVWGIKAFNAGRGKLS